MSTIAQFSPMNLRLYDKDERELRTYVSPLFDLRASASDVRGLCAHIVADNGGGKSTLLLFFEMLFCKPGSNGPAVGKKKAIDYLRRAAFDLHDTTPTTMAALVRRDNASIMPQARDLIFGYTMRLRDSEGTSLDLRRFVIHLVENPSFSLSRLATEVVYDAKGSPRSHREVCERLGNLAGCTVYESSEWDAYAHEMLEAGISPILWRELAKMNADEEAAGSYFQSNDAFRNIVRLVSEAQEPMSGERTKPLWDVATTIARQVSTQVEDRAREASCGRAGEAVHELSAAVERYADAREALKQTQDAADKSLRLLKNVQEETSEQIEQLKQMGEWHQQRRVRNRQMRVSLEIAQTEARLVEGRRQAQSLEEDYQRKRQAHREAAKRLCLDDAAHSYARYKKLDSQYSFKKNELDAKKQNMDADEELRQASARAWADLFAAEATTQRAQHNAQTARDEAHEAFASARREHVQADEALGKRREERGKARGTFDIALQNLQSLVARVEPMRSAQPTMTGFYVQQTIESLASAAQRAERKAQVEQKNRKQERERCARELEETQCSLDKERLRLHDRQHEAVRWEGLLARGRELDDRLRSSLALWEEATELAVTGQFDEARAQVDALYDKSCLRERLSSERADYLQRKLDALAAGRLDMSEQLRHWLDQHAITARTLASYKGIKPEKRAEIFEERPWLAHVLVVDGRAASALEGMEGDQDLLELGHPVFYLRQTDVHAFLEGKEDALGLVHTLHTLERAYLDDPKAYQRHTEEAYRNARADAATAHETSSKLALARDELVTYRGFFDSLNMGEVTTLAHVEAQRDFAISARDKSKAQVEDIERTLRGLKDKLEQLAELLAQAELSLQTKARECQELQEVLAQNGQCVRLHEELGAAEQACVAAEQRKEAAFRAQEDARSKERIAQDELDTAQRDANRVGSLRKILEELALTQPDEQDLSGHEERRCSSEELDGSVRALREIVLRNNKTLEQLQGELEELRAKRQEEDVWKQKLRNSGVEGVVLLIEEIEAWVPNDEVARDRLVKENIASGDTMRSAESECNKARNKVSLLEGQLANKYEDLRDLGIDVALEVPSDYDYASVETQISIDAERDERLLKRATNDDRILNRLNGELLALVRAMPIVGSYQAKTQMETIEFSDLDGWEQYVRDLNSAFTSQRREWEAATTTLTQLRDRAKSSVQETGMHAIAHSVGESIDTVQTSCQTHASTLRVAQNLEDHAQHFMTMVATLRNKLRTTNEAVEDLVERSVSEGYRLMDELHHLVMSSQVRIKNRPRQRTIDFMVGGRSRFGHEIQRDEVAKNRLARYVRDLLMDELPNMDETKRVERAKTKLEPHELVYSLLDERFVEVRYPVIRGGKRMSYETARDTGGSGSTGQKSAGYVLAFLALLRYLGNVGSLGSEGSLFVALENQFGKISSSKIILDIKEVVDVTHMQLITVAGRELRSAYAMGDVVFTLYRARGVQEGAHGSARLMRAQINESDQLSEDAVIDKFRATRQFENLSFDF